MAILDVNKVYCMYIFQRSTCPFSYASPVFLHDVRRLCGGVIGRRLLFSFILVSYCLEPLEEVRDVLSSFAYG